jgi:tRNA A37 threonylcarbamoyladenosine dehydratase
MNKTPSDPSAAQPKPTDANQSGPSLQRINPFARTEQLLGTENLKKIQSARVAIFGLGAVGSFAAEALARSGVGRLDLIDFDRVDPSNLNRQLFALHSTIGQKKSVLAAERIKDINPSCTVTIHSSFVNAQSLDDLLNKDIDVVVDAIDGLNSKVNLLVAARQMGLEVVSSMGAGGRTDASEIKSVDISQTCICPLARVVRQRLRRRGIYEGIHAVYSKEKPLNKQPFKTEDAQDALTDHGRSRPPIGTVCWVPGIFGLTIAGKAIQIILSAHHAPHP